MRTYGRPLACPGKCRCDSCTRGTHIFRVNNPPFLLKGNPFPMLILDITALAMEHHGASGADDLRHTGQWSVNVCHRSCNLLREAIINHGRKNLGAFVGGVAPVCQLILASFVGARVLDRLYGIVSHRTDTRATVDQELELFPLGSLIVQPMDSISTNFSEEPHRTTLTGISTIIN